MSRVVLVGAIAVLAAGVFACQERLTSPGECPDLCPGGSIVVHDTVLTAVLAGDESVAGYVARGAGAALLVSNGLPASEDRAVYRFGIRPDSITVRDTARSYIVDSVSLAASLVARDTLVTGLKLFLYRLPAALSPDTATFAGVEPLLADSALIDSIVVPDSVRSGQVRVTLRGADVAKVALPAGSGGVLTIGLRVGANAPTGVRVGATGGSDAATLTTFVTVDVADTNTSIVHQALIRGTETNTFVTQSPYAPSAGTLLVGGEPSSRAFVRFDLPQGIEDSATVVRATLELVPVAPIPGLPGDPAVLEGRAVLSDLGPKSPLANNNEIGLTVQDTLVLGSADTVRLEVTSLVRLWQSSTERPQAIALLLRPEAASFTRALFGSTDPASPVPPPRLRITYLLSFPFERP